MRPPQLAAGGLFHVRHGIVRAVLPLWCLPNLAGAMSLVQRAAARPVPRGPGDWPSR
jgi:hypothetical protein